VAVDVRDGLPELRTTERSTFKRCPQRWWWRYRDGLEPRMEKADARWFGTGVHVALAEYYGKGYRRGRHPAKIFKEWCGDEIGYVRVNLGPEFEFEKPKFEDATELGVEMLENYVAEYGKDPDWYIIATEQDFAVKIMREGKPVAIFASTWDGVLRSADDGRIYLLEHKTAASVQLAYLELDDQAGAYFAVATTILRARGILKPGEEIAGIVYNFLRKGHVDLRPRNEGGAYLNKDGSVSKRQPPPLLVRHFVERGPNEVRSQMQRIADEVAWMDAIRSGQLPLLKNTSKDCTFCDFFDMCRLHERGGDSWKELARTQYDIVDPYADKRKSAAIG
jgi:hypothetical protein